ncbi:hypothetical protein BGX26_008249, partial [Mortierella sp. AD094]
MVKRSGYIKKLVAGEARKAYHPPAIAVAVKEMAADQGFEDINPHLRRQEVANIQATCRKSQMVKMVGPGDLGFDIESGVKFLSENDYLTE